MVGFSERVIPASSLIPGDKVAWWGDTLRVVQSVAPMGDGTDHWHVVYKNETTARYAGRGLVRVLEIAPLEIPVAVVAPGSLCFTDA